MEIPRILKKQMKEYERAGFHPVQIEHRAGSHWKVVFAEFPEPQFLTQNIMESHSIRNNISRFKNAAKKAMAS